MGDILRRRGMMVVPSSGPSPLPEWDYEWDYSDGLPTATGWTKGTSQTTSEAIEDTYLKVTSGGGSGNYIRYTNSSYLTSKGVLEVKFRGVSSSNTIFTIGISDGTNGLSVQSIYTSSYKGIYLCDASSTANRTKLLSLSSATGTYTVKLVIDNGYGSVYINGTLYADNVDLSTIVSFKTLTQFRFANNSTGSGTVTGRFYSVKVKVGRT